MVETKGMIFNTTTLDMKMDDIIMMGTISKNGFGSVSIGEEGGVAYQITLDALKEFIKKLEDQNNG